MNVYLYGSIKESEDALFNAIKELEGISELEKITSSLTKKLEKKFGKIPDKDGKKILGDLIYFQSGLIKNSNNYTIIASPWEMTSPILPDPPKNEKRVISKSAKPTKFTNNFGDVVNKSVIIAQQLRYFSNQRLSYCEKSNVVKQIKQLEVYYALPKENRDNIMRVYPNEILLTLKTLLSISWNALRTDMPICLFTENQCKELLKAYQVFELDKMKDGFYYQDTRNFVEKIKKLFNDNLKNAIIFDINFKDYNNDISRVKMKCYNEGKTSEEVNEKLDQLKVEYILKIYQALYEIKDKNLRSFLIAAKLIEEGYVPKISVT